MPYSQSFQDDVAALDTLFTSLARRHLSIPTLRIQGQDGKDFHEVHVPGVLQAAYLEGYQDGLEAA
jgi:hypothetical protein